MGSEAHHPNLNILELTRVSPPADEATTEFTLPLTFFDILLFKAPPVKRLFFYSLPEATPSFFDSVIVPKLKRSLSLALSHYLPLAGRIIWPPSEPKPISRYIPKNDGVSLTVAESTADFASLSCKRIKHVSELHALVPHLDSSEDEAEAISVQITLFPDRGFAVGITANHLVQDGQSTTAFIKAWAHICREGEAKEVMMMMPSFDRTRLKDPTRLDLLYLNQWMDFADPLRTMKLRHNVEKFPPDMVFKTFDLSGEDIEWLKSKVTSSLEKLKRRPSTFVVTMAYTMTCLVRVKAEYSVNNRAVSIGFPADGRPWLGLRANYFGNCIVPVYGESASAEDFMKEDGFEFAVKRVTDAIERLESDPLADMDEKVTKIMGFIKSAGAGEAMPVSVTDSPRFGFYGMDFGWGRPELVELVSADRGGVMGLGESRHGKGGVEVGLAMNKQEMERFVELFAESFQGNA